MCAAAVTRKPTITERIIWSVIGHPYYVLVANDNCKVKSYPAMDITDALQCVACMQNHKGVSIVTREGYLVARRYPAARRY
jgi:hypothetical protein